ncbi:GHMP family kinase ATP-binding protein [Caulifigura coniformis]|nr:beta-RFAP synthase [Caulifigura coniformis]
MRVITGSRLHFGPLAWKPRRGRDFGGWGVMLETPRTAVRVGHFGPDSEERGAALASQGRAEQVLRHLAGLLPQSGEAPPQVIVDEEPPPHCGFGSGTQLALAVAAGASELAGLPRRPATEMAELVGRGLRSAVGIHGFDQGGLLVDAGKHPGDAIGALAARVEIPSGWRFVLIRPPVAEGFTGEKEAAVFECLPSFSEALSDRLSRILLTGVIPSVRQGDCPAFAEALDEYGVLVGEAFSACQGGVVHPASLPIWKLLRDRGVKGIAQTSWGPTLAVVCDSAEAAEELVQQIPPSASVQIARPKNDGATISRL